MVEYIKTARLTIRPIGAEDRGALQELFLQEQVGKTYMLPDFSTPDVMEKLLCRLEALSRAEDRFVRAVCVDDRPIGLVNDVGITEDSLELGYAFHPQYWGQGYATEMLRAVLDALLGKPFTTIRAGAFAENTASQRVMEKCGMERQEAGETVLYRGTEHPCVSYAITAGSCG